MHTFSQKEFSPPHSINAAPLAPPQSSAGPHPTQVIAAHPTTKPLKPLRQFISVWKVIPGISRWLLNVIERGYTLQFRRRPPRFNGVVQSLTSPRNAQALRQEIGCLLKKRSSRASPTERAGERFLQPLLRGTQEGWGAPPNSGSQTHQQSALQTSVQDDNAETDPGANSPRGLVCVRGLEGRVLSQSDSTASQRFAFENTAYQYSVLPFGLALAPCTFSKCVDAALSPLRASGMRILNYLDDWLILAQSRDTLLSHIDSLLIHLESLGLCVNRRKSILALSQSIMYLGVCMDSLEMRAASRESAWRPFCLTCAISEKAALFI